MMLRAVVRFILPLAVATALCFHGSAQTTPDAPVPMQGASTISSSTNLSSDSNDLASLYGTPVEQIIARVNDQVITNSDVTRAQTQMAQDARQNNWSIEQLNRGHANLLRDLIDQQLLISKGKQLSITGDTELIKRLDEIRKENHLDSLDDLEKAVEQQGISYEDFKANIRNSIITQQVVRDEVGSKMQMSQAEIQAYYKEHQDTFTHEESVHLNEILIPTAENATSAELAAADAKAKEVEAKLKTGASFTELAKQYSGGPTAQQGGDLGEFHRGALAKVLEDQTFDLPVGGYTAPIRTRQGYILLQVTVHTPGGTAPLQKVEPQIEQTIYMEKIGPAVRRYLTRLRDEAYIDIRPGYTDSDASPNETKPTFAAYTPPQPKKKKKQKARYDSQAVRYSRTVHAKAPTQVASAAAPETTAPAASVSSSSTAGKRVSAKKHEAKREKFRFGRAPATPVSAEQVATSANAPEPTSAENQTSTAGDTAPGTDVEPLGPDLEHAPLITQPKVGKTRLSDQARNKSEMAARKNHRATRKAKKVKHDNAKPTSLTPTEAASRQVQSSPLGLNGATAAKKKKKKIVVNTGEKTRLSDQKKSEQQKTKGNSNTPGTPASSSSDSSGSGGNAGPSTPPPPASSSTDQP